MAHGEAPAPLLRAIDAIASFLFSPLTEKSLLPAGWRLLGWDGEQGLQATLRRGREVVLVEFGPRDETRDCYARTRRFNVCARRSFASSGDLSPGGRRAADAVVAAVRSRERALPDVERSRTGRACIVREVAVARLLMPEGSGHYYINPYVGCTIGCAFCYVAPLADLSRGLEGLPALPWGRYVDVKVNAAEVLEREVRVHPPGIVRLSPILTDPYQPLERRCRVTRRCLEVLLGAGFSPVILTRAGRVVEDLDLLRRFRAAAVGLSVPTDDDRVRQRFEPGADPIPERLEALKRCRDAGVRTFAVVQPMLPMDPERLAGRLAPLVDCVRVDRMHDLPRLRGLYEAAGMPEAAEEPFFARTEAALRKAFAKRRVRFDEMDDLSGILGLG
ncbi:MAG: radical SAM protein [Elusimicrobia bacterium]|nr:radical SAM protein [Elusimicrobiota bacterium]